MTDLLLGQKLSDSAREYANVTIAALPIPGGVHPPTVVAACARMAGTYLFRSFDLKLPGVQPGQAVLSVEANEHSPMLLRTAAGILATLGITIASSPPAAPTTEPPKPMYEFLPTQRLLEPRFAAVTTKHGLTTRQAAQGSAIATAILIHHFAKHLEPDVGFGLAAFGFIEGSKTAPDPVALSEPSPAS